MKTLRLYSFFLCCALGLPLWAQIPAGYYTKADGKSGAELKTALFGIIGPHTNVGYDGLWTVYEQSDIRPDGKIWDMYSDCTNYTFAAKNKSYSKEGDSVNREHTVPQSWFNEGSPMKSDAFHVVPTDGYVNNRRSNYPYGEVGSTTYTSHGGFCKLGSCTTPGYSGTVFEPADEYKGDFARIYFYMATCYEDKIKNWGGVFGNGAYPGMATWTINMLLRWAANDPVSQKEIDRNEAVYGFQHNRNPYVDYPGLEQYVWGSLTAKSFSSTAYVKPDGNTTNPPVGPVNPGGEGGDDKNPGTPPGGPTDANDYVLVTSASQLASTSYILIVCGEKSVAMQSSDGTRRNSVGVTISDSKVSTLTGTSTTPYAFILSHSVKGYTIFDPIEKAYLCLTSSDNSISNQEELTNDGYWNISFSGTSAVITNQARNNYTLRYNPQNNIFRCYKSGQSVVQIYQGASLEGISTLQHSQSKSDMHYDLSGRPCGRQPKSSGLYISGGHKYLVR